MFCQNSYLKKKKLKNEIEPSDSELNKKKIEMSSRSTSTPKNTCFESLFSQRDLPAWQLILTPKLIISSFLVISSVFLLLGIILVKTNQKVIECSISYPDPKEPCIDPSKCKEETIVNIDKENCVGNLTFPIKAPVYIYYELKNYYQNHREYIRSRNNDQLRGIISSNEELLQSCYPVISDPENKKIYLPCGLIASTVFNDTYHFFQNNNKIIIDDSPETITWSVDRIYNFKNPKPGTYDPNQFIEWLDESIFPNRVENGHFIVWMRTAAFPSFRKLYGKIDQDLNLPIQIKINNRYITSKNKNNSKKKIVISTTTNLGGRNNFIGIAYIVIGAVSIIFAIIIMIFNLKESRIYGDIKYLKSVFISENS